LRPFDGPWRETSSGASTLIQHFQSKANALGDICLTMSRAGFGNQVETINRHRLVNWLARPGNRRGGRRI
jgi:hypothetical protein